MTELKTYRLEGFFRLKSPLSHIGESISNKSYLVQERILQPNGTVEEVFCYSGNAWRGQLRDQMGHYMLESLGHVKIALDPFHLIFSGGRIGGAQNTDIEQARRIRAAMPVVSVLGGGVGNQILEGKLIVSNCYPVCREAIPVLPSNLHEQAETIAYADCTFEKEHSRRDDSKIESVRKHLLTEETLLLEGGKSKKAEKDGPADQMRIGMELVCPGVTLTTSLVLRMASEVELGALVSGIHRFSQEPHIGGKIGIGYGLVDLHYSLRADDGEHSDFITVQDGQSLLSPVASEAKDAYDQHLRSIYDAYLTDNASGIRQLLGAA